MTLMPSSQAASPTTELACGTRQAVAACVDVLRQVVAGLDPDTLVATEAPEVWSCFDQVERLGASAKILVARKIEDSGVWKAAGMRSAAEYLALRSGTTREAARDALKTSERITNLPHLQDALRRGELSAAQAHLIADAANHDPTCQTALVDHAKTASFKELKDECLRRKAAADPKPQDTRDRIYKDRRFRLSTDPEGAWCFSGRGPLDHAGTFAATLNPLIDDQFKKARTEGKREERDALAYDALQEMARLARAAFYGDDLDPDDSDSEHDEDTAERLDDASRKRTSPGDQETDGRPRAAGSSQDTATTAHPTGPAPAGNATSTGSGRAGSSAVGDAAGPRPAEGDPAGGLSADDPQPPLPGHSDPGSGTGHRRRTAGANRKNRKKRRRKPNPSHMAILRLDVEALRRGYTQGDELCEVQGVGPVSVQAARDLLGDAIVKLVVTKGTAVASVVHLGRGPNAAQRTALLWAQPECTVEGCPHTFTQVDHRHDWHKAKVTELHNLDRLCPHHHAKKTHQNWALVPGTGKRPMVPPDDPRHPTAATRKEQHPQAQAA